MELTVHRRIRTAVAPSPHVLEVAAMFGLGIDERRELELIPPTTLRLEPRRLVFITGPSGSGKSSLLTLIAEAAARRDDAVVIRFDQLPEPSDRPLVDVFGDEAAVDPPPLKQVLRWLSLAGLNDAFVMLRRPKELSDGQRYRLRLAQTMAAVDRLGGDSQRLPIVLADEFGATLDRRTAAVLAGNVRKWVTRTPVAFVAATTHDDLLEPLEPDVLIEKPLGASVHVLERPARADADQQTN